ncbi:diaminopimelate epimerase [Lacihabitans lacunae]|uniref:Diaminopimelate epimerase n=1 Tax=Lacihabitans lacunae TaxID=1028214 RepID=A0ABV7Z078_9BACT
MGTFFKYQGTGNDFVMIDNRLNDISLSESQIEHLCHRRFGIGADGLIIIENADGYDFRMKYYNADGKEGSMCGNGGRCAVKFASDLGVFSGSTSFIAVDGPHEASIENDIVSLGMIDVSGVETLEQAWFLNTGSPHYIAFEKSLETKNVKDAGAEIRYADFWVNRGGTNVNFVEQIGENEIFVRTYERGVEDETYSCGTGVTAAALISNLEKGLSSPIKIKTLGGNLSVGFANPSGHNFTNIELKGPAIRVFEGVF